MTVWSIINDKIGVHIKYLEKHTGHPRKKTVFG